MTAPPATSPISFAPTWVYSPLDNFHMGNLNPSLLVMPPLEAVVYTRYTSNAIQARISMVWKVDSAVKTVKALHSVMIFDISLR